MTRLIALSCNHCGAPLEVPGDTRFLTCGHCSSRLEVQRSGDAVFTKVLEALDQRTTALAKDVEILKLQNNLERLDREWATESQSYMSRSKNGVLSEPTVEGTGFQLFIIILIGLGLVVGAGVSGEVVLALFGVLVLVFGGLVGNSEYARAQEYQQRKQSFRCEREALSAKIYRLEHKLGA